MTNKKVAQILYEIGKLLDIQGVAYKPKVYQKAAKALEDLKENISHIYKKEGIKGIKKIPGIGESIAKKIVEYLKNKKIKYHKELKEKSVIRQIITHYFETKGLSLAKLKKNAKKRKIVYSRFTKPAKQLLTLAGSVEKSKAAISKVSKWAKSRNLDYAIETVFKKWLELDRLKPKEIVKKPYYRNDPMVWSKTKRKWYVIDKNGNWLEFADKESEIEWRIVKYPSRSER